MPKPVLITTPFPAVEEVAKVYGVSKKRLRWLLSLVPKKK